MLTSYPWSEEQAVAALRDARRRTLELVADLDESELVVPERRELSPFLWELGRVGWSHERLILRRRREPPVRADAERRFDDTVVGEARWKAADRTREQALRYLEDVQGRVLAGLERVALDDQERHHLQLALAREDECAETLTELRQALALRAPRLSLSIEGAPGEGACPGDAAIAGGSMLLGAEPEERFVRDEERWAHTVDVQPFRIARAPVTQAEFANFVAEGGYARGEFWTDAGWRWRQRAGAEAPLYWKRDGPELWLRRRFDRWLELEPNLPMLHVNAHEAEAYCRFAERALPSEAEWEFAAGWLMRIAKTYPWGWHAFAPELANLDGLRHGAVDVNAFPQGDSVHGCRQMLGNVWEWTASTARPYPGFARGADVERALASFDRARVVRGGSFATRARFLSNTTRSFLYPERREGFVGFRTVAV